MKRNLIFCAVLLLVPLAAPHAAEIPVSPMQAWADYDPNQGDFKEEIVKAETKDGNYYRESYISAYVAGAEIRIFCQYKVRTGAKNAPGLLNVHGWMGAPGIDPEYVNDGWAEMTYDYCGDTRGRAHFTKYPETLKHCNMDAKFGGTITTETRDHQSITDPKQTSLYVWYAMSRRVLSYLEQQKEVDRTRLGARGYSYGGTLMWQLATDPRIKAVVAYFGIGWLEYYRNKQVWLYNNPYVEPAKTPGEELFLATVAPEAYVPFITAAVLFLNGSNDHHGVFERGLESFKKFRPDVPWAFAIQARGHHNTEKTGQDCKLWLEKYVLNKEVFWPAHPQSEIKLNADGVPELRVTAASPERVTNVEMWYALKNPNYYTRTWRDVECVKRGAAWVGQMPVTNVDDYVFAFANINYDTTVVVSTAFNAAIPAKLGRAKATDKTAAVIYVGDGGLGAWSNVAEVEGVGGIKGFRCTDNAAGSGTELMSNAKWKAPPHAQLGFKFYCTEPQTLLFSADNYEAEIEITASDRWQELALPANKFIHRATHKRMGSWQNIAALHLKPKAGADLTKVVFAQFHWKK
ncbi:MAG: prolyl oligopeptidase family serine peptidase [Kiritimatiellaeota bacterium]|nr:prolyl oligopeptidase family serine peptidase [Kiritimatiellota bacterium]